MQLMSTSKLRSAFFVLFAFRSFSAASAFFSAHSAFI